eukprot:g5235.t1
MRLRQLFAPTSHTATLVGERERTRCGESEMAEPAGKDLELSETDVRDMQSFARLSEVDRDQLNSLRSEFAAIATDVIANFYDHLSAHPQVTGFLRDPAIVARLKRLQLTHLSEFFGGDYGVDYCRRRLQVGQSHDWIGLEPQQAIGAYNVLLQLCCEHLSPLLGGQLHPAFLSLAKILLFDAGLTIQAYHAASVQRLHRRNDDLERALRLYHETELKANGFARLAGHEIRNSLNAIANACDEVAEDYQGELPTGAADTVKAASERAWQLVDIVEQILSSPEVGGNPQWVEATAIIDEIRARIPLHADEKVVELYSFDSPVRVWAEPVALVDLMMPEMTGVEMLQRLKKLDPNCEIVLLTGAATVETAVDAMKHGAFDYLKKPCPFEELQLVLTRAFEKRSLKQENVQLRAALSHASPPTEIVGNSQAIQRVIRLVEKVAPTDSPVLVIGETGTGKELVARALHRLSRRAAKPMVTVNCAALQETLLESELFGHEKGAFTGASAAKRGLFEVADGSSLFIDELGELASPLQAKLLRVLEDGSLRRVGSTRAECVDVRIIAATHRNLSEAVSEHRFRDDLYYRLNVLTIPIPPLRERPGDIPLLLDHFLSRAPRGPWTMTDDARRAMCQYEWPGNVRELANVIERATILADTLTIDVTELPPQVTQSVQSSDLSTTTDRDIDNLEERERLHVKRILEREGFSRSRAAEALGIHRRSLYRLIRKYGIGIPNKADQSSSKENE